MVHPLAKRQVLDLERDLAKLVRDDAEAVRRRVRSSTRSRRRQRQAEQGDQGSLCRGHQGLALS
jgi:hypothetical protein